MPKNPQTQPTIDEILEKVNKTRILKAEERKMRFFYGEEISPFIRKGAREKIVLSRKPRVVIRPRININDYCNSVS